MKNRVLYYFVSIFLIAASAENLYAADKAVPAESKKTEEKGTSFVYESGKIVKELIDKNGDGKPDVTIYYKNGNRHHGEGASHFDGKIDTWYLYNEKGVLRQIAKDTNSDGKPDQFITMLKGRNLMLKEYDRNFDGRIDQRKLVAWSPERLKIPGQGSVPGYVALWTEGDDNFDGKIDVYTEKGNKNPSKEKIGKPIDSRPAPAHEEAPPPPSAGGTGQSGDSAARKIKQLNEQHGLKE